MCALGVLSPAETFTVSDGGWCGGPERRRMSSGGVRVLAAVVVAVCVVAVYVLAYVLVGGHGHGHAGLAPAPARDAVGSACCVPAR